MSSSGTVPLKDVWDMLEACAPGYRSKEGKHNWIVYFGDGAPFRNLPKGPHGARKNPETQIGHVKTMVRYFHIEECAKRHIERLR